MPQQRRQSGAKTRLFHQRNGHHASGHGVGNGRAGNHPKQAGRHHADLGRTARKSARHDGGEIDKQLPQAGELGHDAKQDKVKHERGDHANRDSIDAFCAFVEVRHDAWQAVTPVRQTARQVGAKQAVKIAVIANSGKKMPMVRLAASITMAMAITPTIRSSGVCWPGRSI